MAANPEIRETAVNSCARQNYQDALALVECLSQACPRSAPPDRVETAVAALLEKAGVDDTATLARGTAIDLGRSIGYIEVLANIWRQLQARDLVPGVVTEAIDVAGINWRKQDEERKVAVASFCSGWRGVRFEEMLLGCGIGDSFGAGVEFYDGPWIHSRVDGSDFVCHRGDPILHFYYCGEELEADGSGAGQNFLPGMYTDDCEMTLGLIHALMDPVVAGSPTKDDMLRHWKDEYVRGQSHYLLSRFWALGGIGRNGHGGIASVFSGSSSIEKMRERISKMRYPGNAPPMRALPLAFVAGDARLVELAKANADATHPHIKARAASLGVAVAARCFLLERVASSDFIGAVGRELQRLDALSESPGEMVDAETLEYLVGVDALPPPGPLDKRYEDFMSDASLESLCGPQPVWRGPKGDPPDGMPRMVRGLNADAQRTLGCVLYLLKYHTEGASLETLRRCLCIGGDVDSLAALCLAVVGAREGLRFGEPGGIPVHFLQKLESVEYIADTAQNFERWVEEEHQRLDVHPRVLWKIATKEDQKVWEEKGILLGSALDVRDGFLHAADAKMVRTVANRFFAGQEVELLQIDPSILPENTRWVSSLSCRDESLQKLLLASSGGGDSGESTGGYVRVLPDGCLHVHLRQPLSMVSLTQKYTLPLGDDGSHVFPDAFN
eukprot:TRINITY_DN22557_c1_g1_i1.p1 TRINITY_DN22557_c1_g1~~TRINITY_DN22557_c1_g1_i1.p1  ORF type:complete len:671 (-),score=106.16 TRINITY_DN22557_c1_g1_i1:472-2484(-)